MLEVDKGAVRPQLTLQLLDGFEVARRVGPEHMPAVVFVTAYDEYALQAFEVHAIDYLLKPFSVDRSSERSRMSASKSFDAARRC